MKLNDNNENVVDYNKLIKESKISELCIGKHCLRNGIVINVEEYKTHKREGSRFELHKRYVDVHYIIEGCEKIVVQNKDEIYTREVWDIKNDIVFLDDNEKGKEIVLKEGDFWVCTTEDAHMPGVEVLGNDTMVKKAVVKVPISLIKTIKYLILDVDGTLTDGKIYVGDSGEVFKAFNVKDGYGIRDMILNYNIKPIVLTGRKSQIVDTRCRELGIGEVIQGVNDKLGEVKKIGAEPGELAYMGDDRNDLESMRYVKKNGGLVGCPIDANEQVIEVADFVSDYRGGEGAVRQFIDWILLSKYM